MGGEAEANAAALQRALVLLMGPAGSLAGLDTVGDCMRDEDVRAFMGRALLKEILPFLPGPRAAAEQAVFLACRNLDGADGAQTLPALWADGIGAWRDAVPPLLLRAAGNDTPCLHTAFALLIMLFSGLRGDESDRFPTDADTLAAFARLSCDMPPETLAYAALSDQALWGRDLRALDGLEERVADALRNLQLLGLRATLRLAAASV